MRPEAQDDAKASLVALRDQMVERLEDEDRDDLAKPLIACGQMQVLHCANCGHPHPVEARCKKRYCPVCARMIAARFVDRYRSTLHIMKWPLFVTWTAHHSELFPIGGFKPMFTAFGRLRDQRWFRSRVQGGIISGEVTCKNGNGFHYHLHSLLDARWLAVTVLPPRWDADRQMWRRRGMAAQREVSKQWGMAMQREASIHVHRANGEQAAREILKYALDFATLLNAQLPIGPVIDEMRRARLVRAWGNMYGHLRDCDEKPEAAPCPQCAGRWGYMFHDPNKWC